MTKDSETCGTNPENCLTFMKKSVAKKEISKQDAKDWIIKRHLAFTVRLIEILLGLKNDEEVGGLKLTI